MTDELNLSMEHWRNNTDRRKLNFTKNLTHVCTYISVHGYLNTCKHTQTPVCAVTLVCRCGLCRKVGRYSRQVGLTNVQDFADDFAVEIRDSEAVVRTLRTDVT
jgi:hypothetical protein